MINARLLPDSQYQIYESIPDGNGDDDLVRMVATSTHCEA